MADMKWASAISSESDSAAAVAQVVTTVARSMGGVRPDLALLFLSPHHREHYDGIAAAVAEEFAGAVTVGCSGGGVIAAGRELERTPAIALVAGALPGVSVTPFACRMEELPGGATPDAWRSALRLDSASPAGLLLFPDPFTFDAEAVLSDLDRVFPDTVVTGGLASGANQPGENALFAGGRVMRSGVVGVALDGDLRIDAVVAQGCRPIGEPMFVTGSERNLVRQLDGRPAFDVLRDTVDGLSPADLELARHSLFVGLVMRPRRESYGAGDYLIRNLIGVDPESGVVGVGGAVEEGSVLQFHLRDKATSAYDFARMLDQHQNQIPTPPDAVLLFSCLGRGEGLYGVVDHDSSLLVERFGSVPIGGFFCNGEIGPVQGRTYLHGYTSSMAMLRRGTR